MSFDHEAHWAGGYRDAGDDYLFGTAPNKFLAAQAEYFGDGVSVLSVADGEGRNAVWLAEQGCAVTATEISSVALEKAAKLARGRHVATTEAMAGPRVDFIQADIFNWDWPQAAFDVVVGIFIQFAGPAERPAQLAGFTPVRCYVRYLLTGKSYRCVNTKIRLPRGTPMWGTPR